MGPAQAKEQKEEVDPLEVAKEAETHDDARRQQDEKRGQFAPRDDVQFPTWRYSKDGRRQVVRSPEELEQVEQDGEWQDKPFEEPDQPYSGERTFASPVDPHEPDAARRQLEARVAELERENASLKNSSNSQAQFDTGARSTSRQQADEDAKRLEEEKRAIERDEKQLEQEKAEAERKAKADKAKAEREQAEKDKKQR